MKIRVYEGVKREFQKDMERNGGLMMGEGKKGFTKCRQVWELSHRSVVYVKSLVSSTRVR